MLFKAKELDQITKGVSVDQKKKKDQGLSPEALQQKETRQMRKSLWVWKILASEAKGNPQEWFPETKRRRYFKKEGVMIYFVKSCWQARWAGYWELTLGHRNAGLLPSVTIAFLELSWERNLTHVDSRLKGRRGMGDSEHRQLLWEVLFCKEEPEKGEVVTRRCGVKKRLFNKS